MQERGKQFPSPELIEIIKSGERPIDKFVARSLEELFSDRYTSMATEKEALAFERLVQPVALRFVAIRDNSLVSFTLYFKKELSRREKKEISEKFTQVVDRLPTVPSFLIDLIERLKREGLQTAGAIFMTEILESGKGEFYIIYPKAFDSPYPPPFGSTRFLPLLKMVPLQKWEFNFPIPNR